MARKGRSSVNVPAAIREYLKANSDVGATAAAEAVSKQIGKKVSPTYVSNIKSNMNGESKKKGRKGKRPGRKAAYVASASRASSNGTVELKTIVAVKALLASVDADKARQLIDLLA